MALESLFQFLDAGVSRFHSAAHAAALLDRADELSEKTAELKERIAALRQAKICPACGAACGRDDQFCRRCGGSL